MKHIIHRWGVDISSMHVVIGTPIRHPTKKKEIFHDWYLFLPLQYVIINIVISINNIILIITITTTFRPKVQRFIYKQ